MRRSPDFKPKKNSVSNLLNLLSRLGLMLYTWPFIEDIEKYVDRRDENTK